MTKSVKTSKTASATPRRATNVVRSPASVSAKVQDNQSTALYQVLQPFWLSGTTVKPSDSSGASVWVEMTEAEALPYQEAGVLGSEPSVIPEPEQGKDDAGATPFNAP